MRTVLRSVAVALVIVAATASIAVAGQKVPADSPTPTAGVCTTEHGHVATVSLDQYGAVPDCLQARRGQDLRIVNHTGAKMTLRWADRTRVVRQGGAVTFPRPMGAYLDAGDHRITGPRYYSAEVWMPGHIVIAPVSAG